MTQNQIAYWNYIEQGRANRAKEAQAYREHLETKRSNRSKEHETNRHNLATEGNELEKIRVQEDYNQDYLKQSYKLALLGNQLTKEGNKIKKEANQISRERNLMDERISSEKLAYSNVWNQEEYDYRREALAQQADLAHRANETQVKSASINASASRYATDVNSQVNRERNQQNYELGSRQANVSEYSAFANAENTATRNRNDYVLGLASNETNQQRADTYDIEVRSRLAGQVAELFGKAAMAGMIGG